MRIDDSKRKPPAGYQLDSFSRGNCIRLVNDDSDVSFLGNVYIVGNTGGVRPLAINLLDGSHRTNGLFVLEPNAKVVIE